MRDTGTMSGAALAMGRRVLVTGLAGSGKSTFSRLLAAKTEILAALKKKSRDLAALSKRFQEALARDYFASTLGKQARERLLAAGGG